ncbi:hypothetical protein D3C87_1769590 [compost metagenome]
MREQHQRRQNRRPGDQWDGERDQEGFFPGGKPAAVALLRRENHFDGDQKQNNPAGNGHGFGSQVEERQNFLAGEQEYQH